MRALTMVDLCQNHESLEQFDKICDIQQMMNELGLKQSHRLPKEELNSLSSDALLLMNFKGQKTVSNNLKDTPNYIEDADQKLKVSLFMKAIV
jgi:hypothetical protein